MRQYLCWGVHLFTASGALCGVAAVRAICAGAPEQAFLWMFAAVFIDSVDGFLARALAVSKHLPQVDGRRLDDMVDYFTWVVTPVLFMVTFKILPDQPLIWGAPLLVSGLGMASLSAKTDDNFFQGFPSLWNVVALYLWWWQLPADINAGIVITLALLVLTPTRYIYPSKTPHGRSLTVTFMALWLVQVVALLARPDLFQGVWRYLSLAFPLYYLGYSFYLDRVLPSPGDSPLPEQGI